MQSAHAKGPQTHQRAHQSHKNKGRIFFGQDKNKQTKTVGNEPSARLRRSEAFEKEPRAKDCPKRKVAVHQGALREVNL